MNDCDVEKMESMMMREPDKQDCECDEWMVEQYYYKYNE